MDMEKAKKTLKIYSIFLIVLSVCNVLSTVLSLIGEDVDNAIAESGVSDGIIKAVMIIMIVYTAIVFVIELYLGVKGLMQLNGRKGYGHITVAGIVFVLVAIGLVFTIISGITSGFDWTALLTDLVDLSILYEYRKVAKVLRDN